MSEDPNHLHSIPEAEETNNEYILSSSPPRGHARRPSQLSNTTNIFPRGRQGCYSHSSWGAENPSMFDISSQPRSVSVPTDVTSLYSPRTFEAPGTPAAWRGRDDTGESSDDDEDTRSVLSRPSGPDASRRRLSNQLYAVGSHIPNPELDCRRAGPETDQNAPYPKRIADEDHDGSAVLEHAPTEVSIGADYQASDDQRGDGGSSSAAPDGQRDARPAGNEGRVEFWKSPRPGTSSTPQGSISTTARSSPAERADTTASKASLDGLPTNEASEPASMTLSYRVGYQQVAAGDSAVRDRSEKAKKKTSEALQEEGGSKSAEPAKGSGKPKNSKQLARRGRNK